MTKKLRFIALSLLGITLGIYSRYPRVHEFNLTVSLWLQSWHPHWLTLLSLVISGVEYLSIPLSLVLFLYFFRKKQEMSANIFLLAGFAWIVQIGLKILFNVPCPTPQEVNMIFPFHGLINMTTVCYPSGHVFDYVSLWGVIYVYTKQKWVKYLAVFLIVTVGLSRLILGAHLLTDVMGGYLFGFAWLLILTTLLRNE